MRSLLAFGLFLVAAAAPAGAGVILQTDIVPDNGTAVWFGDSQAPVFLNRGSVWITVGSGAINYLEWNIDGQLAKLWWDEFGGGFDENGNPLPALTGNEYFYSPSCTSTGASPVCGGIPLATRIAGPRLGRVDFNPPADFNTCTPTFVVAGDCAESYRFSTVFWAIAAENAGTDPVRFTIYDTNPVPEPAAWAMLIAGFGLVGATQRRRRQAASRA